MPAVLLLQPVFSTKHFCGCVKSKPAPASRKKEGMCNANGSMLDNHKLSMQLSKRRAPSTSTAAAASKGPKQAAGTTDEADQQQPAKGKKGDGATTKLLVRNVAFEATRKVPCLSRLRKRWVLALLQSSGGTACPIKRAVCNVVNKMLVGTMKLLMAKRWCKSCPSTAGGRAASPHCVQACFGWMQRFPVGTLAPPKKPQLKQNMLICAACLCSCCHPMVGALL
eukprot:scaffold71127_cov20-Tisochrysis_lutea.AAC.1